MVYAANYSVGVNTLFWLTRQAARILGPTFDLEVVEMHHRLKKDAPQWHGAAVGGNPRRGSRADLRRSDPARPRGASSAHAPARRSASTPCAGGDVVGEHTVFFADEGERLELVHRATSRDTFALGALRAAAWLRGRPPEIVRHGRRVRLTLKMKTSLLVLLSRRSCCSCRYGRNWVCRPRASPTPPIQTGGEIAARARRSRSGSIWWTTASTTRVGSRPPAW